MHPHSSSDLYKWLRVLTITTIVFMIAYGAVVSIFEIKPFWLDEWNIIYNLKTKTHSQLWGHLEYMQQFPRVYLQIIKYITSPFEYSYSSLRLPSFVVHTAGLIFCFILSGRIFGKQNAYRFFWLLIYASYSTSIEYFVQVKQYTMEMLLALTALWQLLELLHTEAKNIQFTHYIFLCLLFTVIPFFSYTYPICFAALCFTIALHTRGFKNILYRSIPLLLGSISIFIFYHYDVAQVMADERMQNFWKDYILDDGFRPLAYLFNIYKLFANLGTGQLFEVIYGTLGLGGFCCSIYQLFQKRNYTSPFQYIVQYSLLLVIIMIILFSFHKLPVGAHRLNAFAVPACSILVTNMLLVLEYKRKKLIPIIYTTLSITLAGNIYQAFAKAHFSEESVKKQRIYDNTNTAISLAEEKRLPIATGTGVVYPYEDRNADFVIISYPAYHMGISLPVYNAANTFYLKKVFEEHPELQQVVFIDRLEHSIVRRQQALNN